MEQHSLLHRRQGESAGEGGAIHGFVNTLNCKKFKSELPTGSGLASWLFMLTQSRPTKKLRTATVRPLRDQADFWARFRHSRSRQDLFAPAPVRYIRLAKDTDGFRLRMDTKFTSSFQFD